MCAIGRNLDQSVGALSPASTMLGSAAIGGSTATGPKRVIGGRAAPGTLLTGAATGPASGGTLLTGGGGTRPKNLTMER